MRGMLSILVTVIVCVIVLALYFFVGRGQLNRQITAAEAEKQSTLDRLQKINRMRNELPVLMEQLPHWKDRLALYKEAIPEPIEDQQFLIQLARELKSQDVRLLSVDLTPRGSWLGDVSEEAQAALIEKGIDPEQARQVMAATYSINLHGPFKNVLTAFENLKKYRRLYTIDEVSGPAGGGGGAVMQIVDPDIQAIQVKGRIYYGITDDYLTSEDLTKVFESSVIRPEARRMQAEIAARGQRLLANPDLAVPEHDGDATEATDAAEPAGDPEADDPNSNTANAGLTANARPMASNAREEG